MSKHLSLTFPLALLLLGASAASAGVPRNPAAALRLGAARGSLAGSSEREQDGLAGPVRRVKTETAKIAVKGGKPVEGPRQVLETTTYDQKGNRVDNAYFLAAGGSLTGKEVYKYDDRGNMIEMTLHNDDGTLLAKEVYEYEFDAVGNWIKMTTSVAVMEGGRVTFEPSEVTYRSISYYLDQTVLAKMSQPTATQTTATATAAPTVPATVAANAQPQPVKTEAPKTVAPSNTTPTNNATANNAAPSNTTAATQAKVSPTPATPAKPAPARNTAATLNVASLDKGSVSAPNVPATAAATNSTALAAGPAVKADGEAPTAAPPVLRSGPLKPISGGILNGKAISLPAPVYPDMAKRARTSGMVEVEVIIDINGKVISAKAVSGPAILQQSAEMAAKLARFTPTLLSGQPMRVVGVITYNFTLQP